jgi:hypothetical protein
MGYNRLTDGEVLSATEQNENLTDIENLSQRTQGYCVLSGLTLSPGEGLSVSVAAGSAVIKKLLEKDASIVGGLPPSTTTYIWLRDDGTFTQTDSLTPPDGPHTLLGSVTTGASEVTGVDDTIAWKGQRVEDGTKLIAGPASLTVSLDSQRVGVGTDSPSDELHVSGIAAADAIGLWERLLGPSAAPDKGYIYAKADGDDTELFYRDDKGNEVQLTQDGEVCGSGPSGIRTFAAHPLGFTQMEGTTAYYPLNGYRGPYPGGEAYTQTKLYDDAYTFRNLRAYISANSTLSSSEVTLRDDGADSSLSVTIGAALTGSFENTGDSAAVAADSLCNYNLTAGAGGAGTIAVQTIQVDGESS